MTAAERAAALLREFDQNRQRDDGARVPSTEPGCRSELLCGTRPTENLAATWRCLEHRETPSTTDPEETTQ